MNKERLARQLLATFLDELDEQLRVLDAELLALDRAPADGDRLRAVFRVAHTLKGAARAVGVSLVESVCHALETRLAEARTAARALTREEIALLFAASDALADACRRLREERSLDDAPVAALLAALRAGPSDGTPRAAAPLSPPAAESGSIATDAAAGATPTADASAAGRADSSLRVGAGKLDELQGAVGQLVLTAGCARRRVTDLEALDALVGSWTQHWRGAARRARSRMRGDGNADAMRLLEDADRQLARLAREVSRIAAASLGDVRGLEAAAEEVADRVRLLRLRPFGDVCAALPRVVRDVSAAGGKEARLELAGTDVEADRAVLDGLREALLQLVRNAVDHGIEAPDVRRRLGKPAEGTVRVTAALRGDRLIVTVADDGAGVDAEGVRASLARAGRPAAADDRQLARALVMGGGGISTRAEASAISGRGVGLDVAHAAVVRLGGSLDVTWRAGRGATFTLDCPTALSRLRAVLATSGPQVVAIPSAQVERLLRVRRAELRHADGRRFVAPDAGSDDQALVPLVALARLLDAAEAPAPDADPLLAIVLRAADERVAIVVDALLAEQELVVRALPRRAALPPVLGGAALLPEGGIALLLDVPLAVAAARERASDAVPPPRGARAAASRRILVVDDSVTTRTLEQSMLAAAGYDVATAPDGAEGWRQLQEQAFDLVVADVEMPRLDGFALCKAIRASRPLAALPVVLVTALESESDRARGLEAGADAYLGKTSFDQQTLLETIDQLLGRA